MLNDQCDYQCSSNKLLKKHVKAVHDKIKDNICPYEECGFSASSKGDLKQHLKAVHDKIKDVECDKCEYKCSDRSSLKIHIKAVHDKIKDFECSQCDYICSTNSLLTCHVKAVHDKIKDFECEQCDYKCSDSCSLKRHIKICTGKLKCSSGELAVMKTLDEMEMKYDFNTSFELKNNNSNYLMWDFIVHLPDTKLFIEFNGIQHYEPVAFGGISKERAEKQFKKQQKHDKLKDDYCKENNYPLLWIKYTDFGRIHEIVSDFIIKHTDWGIE